MKDTLQGLFSTALENLVSSGVLDDVKSIEISFEQSKSKEHGDFATNIAMVLAKRAGMSPRELAPKIIAALPESTEIAKLEIAGPGFINIFIDHGVKFDVIQRIQQQAEAYGHSQSGGGQKILLEYVSANPTGPLHVGHGRGAAYGDTLSRLLSAVGYVVHKEYYVNDAGRQMDILATSVWLRYLQAIGEKFTFPANAYQGDYVTHMGDELKERFGEQYRIDSAQLLSSTKSFEDEVALDGLISAAKNATADDYKAFFDVGLNTLVDDIRNDLEGFGVSYDEWFSERSLFIDNSIPQAIDTLTELGYIEDRGGTLWFKSSEFGDEKDRVVVRENGMPTYFASDIAYHLNKFSRGYTRCINIWGADHHGYIPRVKAALQASGQDPERLTVLLVQFASLYRSGEKVSMSTRSGQFVTLRELRDEVGNDAARFFYVQRKSEQHMDFDLDLAKSQTNENPLYYVQYAHARICSVFRQATERGIDYDSSVDGLSELLQDDNEQQLAAKLAAFPEQIQIAADNFEPHQITYYLRELATLFHRYYNSSNFLDAEPAVRNARLVMVAACRQVLLNGLTLIGVQAPEKM
ncbi:MAG TPA: arginine--tRNA ligase [Gammaproteobacteria bacterium]|nr:arginine--tRNA ligase [Gammaproteobacteria bacterium]